MRRGGRVGAIVKAVSNIFWCGLAWLAVVVVTLGVGLIPLFFWASQVFNNGDERIFAFEERFKKLLMPGETLQQGAPQVRGQALFNRRAYLAITNSRVIYVGRQVFGGFKMIDFQWKDMIDIVVSENAFPNLAGSRLQFSLLGGKLFIVDGVSPDMALAIYSRGQSQEQVWEEKRRIRGIEDARGNFGSYGGYGYGVGGGQQQVDEMAGKLEKIKALLDSGAINDVEFEELKAKIIARG